MNDWLDDLLEAIRRFLRRLRELIREFLNGYGNYTDPPWRWNVAKQRWELRDSQTKSYNCTTYVAARIQGIKPWWGAGVDVVETHEIEGELKRLGWTRDGCDCGCGGGQSKNCAAVYIENGQVIHAAIFDHVRCDWGGKLGPGLPIARFRRAEDYFSDGMPPGAEIRIYCPGPGATAPADGQQKTDEWVHQNA